MITEAWLPADLSHVLTAPALRRTPLYELLSGAGVVVDRMQHEITAEIAGPRNAGLLNVPIGSALVRVNRLAFVAGAPHHYVSILLSPNRSRVLMTQTAAELDAAHTDALIQEVRAVQGQLIVTSLQSESTRFGTVQRAFHVEQGRVERL